MRISNEQMLEAVLNSEKHIWIATDVLYACGVRMNDSNHPDYRRARRVLQKLEKEGFLHSRNFPAVNLTVYWKIP